MGFRVIQRTVEQVEAEGGGGVGWGGAVGCSSIGGGRMESRYEGGGRMEKERKNGATSTGVCCGLVDLVDAGIQSIF